MSDYQPVTVDLFSGVGGFSLGFEVAGFSVNVAIDNSEPAVNTYRRNFPNTTVKELDLSDSSSREILDGTGLDESNVDVVIGGPPCQGFSVMGKRDPDDERNRLLLDFAEYIVSFSPDYFVMENVEGLASGDARSYLDEFLDRVGDTGYEKVEPVRVLNAANFGVPQNRNRLIIIGYKSGVPKPSYPDEEEKVDSWDAIQDLPLEPEDSEIVDGVYQGEIGSPSEYVEKINSWSPKSDQLPDGLTGLEPVDHEQRVRDRFDTVEPGSRDEISRYHRLHKKEPSMTLRAGSSRDRGTHTAARPIHPEAPRVITVREAARIQSFPDWFQFHDTKYYGMRHIGNSVPPLLAKKVGETILKAGGYSKHTQRVGTT